MVAAINIASLSLFGPSRQSDPERLGIPAYQTLPMKVPGIMQVSALVAALFLSLSADIEAQVTIQWSSASNGNNRTSDDAPMDGDFVFQLGVFTGSFEPTMENIGQWEENWNIAAFVLYNEDDKQYNGIYDAVGNEAPFTAGKAAYVWGRRPGSGYGEWILFRAPTWSWPNAEMPGPSLAPWLAEQATIVIIGSINEDGVLMRSALVEPPALTYAQWRDVALEGVAENAPEDDPDCDGQTNLEEFFFDSDPTKPSPSPDFAIGMIGIDGTDYRTLRVPRAPGRLVNAVVEVCGNLKDWESGPGFLVILEVEADYLLVRETSAAALHDERFYRVGLSLP